MKNGNFDFFCHDITASCGAFRQRERVTLRMSCDAERVNDHFLPCTGQCPDSLDDSDVELSQKCLHVDSLPTVLW